MNRKQQIQETKWLIQEGLLKVTEHTGYSMVTNTQIVQEAGVSRMTFYRYFKNKREVLVSLLDRLSQDLKSPTFQQPRSTKEIVEQLVTKRFDLLKNNRLLQHLLSDPQARDIFREYRWSLSEQFFPQAGESMSTYQRIFVLAGIDAITIHWFEQGMVESVESMVNISLAMISQLVPIG